MSDNHIVIGERFGWGDPVTFGISASDRRQHILLIGKTGSGKTTLLRNIMVQFIADGVGFAFIDPHGDESDRLLNGIPPWRNNHVVHFNPSDTEFPVALNLLAHAPPSVRHLVASGIVGAFKGIWSQSWGPRMEYILYNAIAALLDCQNVSLLGVNRMLSDAAYRSWVVRQIKDPFIKDFWVSEYANYDERFQREAIAPVQNKLGQFLLTPVIRNILGQVKCKINFPFMMDHDRILVANLSKGKIGHDKANLLGSLLVAQFEVAAMRRADQPEHERRDFTLIIDEFFNFTTDAFTSILSEARKYRLSLILAHQYIDQLSPAIRQAVFGNVGTVISFRVGYADAEILEREFGHEFSASTLAGLNQFEAVVKLLDQGASRQPFLAKTLPPIETHPGRKETLSALSRERFATPRNVIESKLNRWMTARERDGAELAHGE